MQVTTRGWVYVICITLPGFLWEQSGHYKIILKSAKKQEQNVVMNLQTWQLEFKNTSITHV